MRQYQIRVLIDFVRVLRTKASLGCERKLGHAVVKLFLSRLIANAWLENRFWSRDFASDRGTDRTTFSTIGSFSRICTIFVNVWSMRTLFGNYSTIFYAVVAKFVDLFQVIRGMLLLILIIEWAISLQVFFTYLKWLRRWSELMRGKWPQVLLFLLHFIDLFALLLI